MGLTWDSGNQIVLSCFLTRTFLHKQNKDAKNAHLQERFRHHLQCLAHVKAAKLRRMNEDVDLTAGRQTRHWANTD